MSLFDVCRLCSSKNNLMWVFTRENTTGQKMEEIIYITTGVEIHKKDMVSQKICDKCNQFTTTMFNFRKKCVENDKQLKDMCMKLLKTNDMRIPNTNVTIKHDKSTYFKDKPKIENVKSLHKVHPTIGDLFRKYPKIKLPTPCLNQDVAPFVSMPLDEVENYFKDHNLNFNQHIKSVLKSENGDKKESSNFSNNRSSTSDFFINAEIISDEKKIEDNGIIRPIKIKLFSKDIVNKTIDDNFNASTENLNITHDYGENTSNNHEKPSSTDLLNIPEHRRLQRKRKFSDIGESPNTENGKKPLAHIDKSVALLICDTCDSVHYNAKDLKLHQNKHLHCQFCKMKFLNLESKLLHLENTCLIKNTLENQPYVKVQKIEYNIEIRRQYPDAFSDFPALEAKDSNINNNSKDLNTTENLSVSSIISPTSDHNCGKRHITAEDTMDIINISSDDDDDVIPIMESVNTKTRAVVPTSIAGVVYNSVSANLNEIIIPNIVIKDNNIFNSIDTKMSDKEVLRKLLISKLIKVSAETSTQTYLPTNRFIRVFPHELSAELKNVKHTLHSYKIPVVIKPGFFGVSYNYKMNSRVPKKLHLWSDLQTIDIKAKKKETSVHHDLTQRNSGTNNFQNNINSNNYIPTAEPLSIKKSVFSTFRSIGHKNPLMDNTVAQAVTTTPCPATDGTNSFASNIMDLQQDISQYSSTIRPQAISTTLSPTLDCIKSIVSTMTAPQQGVYQNSSNLKPRTMISTPSSVNSFISNNTLPHQNAHQYLSTAKPQSAFTQQRSSQEVNAAFIPTSTCTNSSALNISQQGVFQYGSTSKPQSTINTQQRFSISKPQEVNAAPILASTCTNSSQSSISVSQRGVYQYCSTSRTQEVTATSVPISTCSSSSVSNISVSQRGVYQYSSTSKSQEITTAPVAASNCTSSSLSNIAVSQPDVYQNLSASKPQEVIPIVMPPSTCAGLPVSNISLSQQDIYQYSPTSASQDVVTTAVLPSTCVSSSVSNVSQQNVYQHCSVSESREVITASILSSMRTVAQQDVYQYSTMSKLQEVITKHVAVSTCITPPVSDISVPRQNVYQYSTTSKPQEVISAPISASPCIIPPVSNISVPQQNAYQYSATFKPQEVITTPIAAPTCAIPSVQNISASRQNVYQHSTTSEPQEVISIPITASTCIIPPVSNISVTEQDAYQCSSTPKIQDVVATTITASTCTNPSASSISVPQQDIYQSSSTPKFQDVFAATVAASEGVNSPTSSISVPQDVNQYSTTSKPQEVVATSIAASTYIMPHEPTTSVPQQDICQYSSSSNISVPQQDVYQNSSTSKPQARITTTVTSSTCTISSVSNIAHQHQDDYQYSSTSTPEETTTVPIQASTSTSVPNIPRQGFIRLRDMSELT